ncbi:MAG: hypothetical protein AAFU85_28975, partial [Planctomycetota bacterium]
MTTDRSVTVDQTDTNQSLTVEIESVRNTFETVMSSSEQFTGAFSSTGTTTFDSTSTEVSSN